MPCTIKKNYHCLLKDTIQAPVECLIINLLLWVAIAQWMDAIRCALCFGIVLFKLYQIKNEFIGFLQRHTHTLYLIVSILILSARTIFYRKFVLGRLEIVIIFVYVQSNLVFAMIEGMSKCFTLCESFTIANILTHAIAVISITYYPKYEGDIILTYLPVYNNIDSISHVFSTNLQSNSKNTRKRK